MTLRQPASTACLLLGSVLLCAGAAQAAPGGMTMGSNPGAASGASAGSKADAEMMSGMATMNRDMAAARPSGDADRDFVTMMLPHHQGAIDMAQVELRYGRDPQMRRLAKAIVAAQATEIGEMKRWLAAHPAK